MEWKGFWRWIPLLVWQLFCVNQQVTCKWRLFHYSLKIYILTLSDKTLSLNKTLNLKKNLLKFFFVEEEKIKFQPDKISILNSLPWLFVFNRAKQFNCYYSLELTSTWKGKLILNKFSFLKYIIFQNKYLHIYFTNYTRNNSKFLLQKKSWKTKV